MTTASSNPFRVGSRGWCTLVHQNHADGRESDSIMAGMFVSLCLASKKPSEREFFVSAGTDLAVKLLSCKILFFLLNFQCLSKRHLHMNYKWSEGQKCLNAWRAWTLTLLHHGAFFNLENRCGDQKFGSQTSWSQNWSLVPELGFDWYWWKKYPNQNGVTH